MQTTNSKDYIELLEVFRIALTRGLLEKSEVVKWADNIIANDNEPDYFIIELSLCGNQNLNDTISLISEFIGQDKPLLSERIILGLLYKQYLEKKITLKRAISFINWILREENLTEEETSLMYNLDLDYDCVEEGYLTLGLFEEEMLRFLEIYNDFKIDNFAEWEKINSTIDGKIKLLSDTVKKEQEEVRKKYTEQTTKKWWKFW